MGNASVAVPAVLLVTATALGGGFLLGGRVAEDRLATASTAVPLEAVFVPALPVLFDDPIGDATDTGTGDTTTQAGCFVGYWVRDECMESPAPLPTVGTPGAHYDIVNVAFAEETEDELVFTLGIAQLTEGFPELATPDAIHRMSSYSLCWSASDDDGCDRWAYLNVMVHDGEAHLEAFFDAYVEDCNDWWWCSWTIPVDIQYGAPGAITFHIPKAYAGIDGEPQTAEHLEAYTGWAEEATAFSHWHPGFTVHTPVRHTHTHTGVPAVFSTTDMTAELPVELEFTDWDAFPQHALDAPLAIGGGGSSHAKGTMYDLPELDIVGFDVYEADGELVTVIAVSEWTDMPDYDFDFELALGIVGTEVWEIGYRQDHGNAYGYAGECIMEECQDGIITEVPVEITPGSPGLIAIHTPAELLTFLGDPQPGTMTTLFSASSMYGEGSYYWGDYDSDNFGDVHSVFMADDMYGGASYVFGSGHRAPVEAFAETMGAHGH